MSQKNSSGFFSSEFEVLSPTPNSNSLLLVCLLFILAGLACGPLDRLDLLSRFRGSPAIQEAKMSKDQAGQQPATTFALDDTFYCIVKLSTAPDDMVVRAVWSAVETEDYDPNFLLEQMEQPTLGSETVWFELPSRSGLWSVGRYRVALYLGDNEQPDQILEFRVEETSPAGQPSPTARPGRAEGDQLAMPVPAKAAGNPSHIATTLLGRLDEDSLVKPLPFQTEPYVHPSGAFTFTMPKGWEVIEEDQSSGLIGDGRSYVGGLFLDTGARYDEASMQSLVDRYVEFLARQFADEYQIEVTDSITGSSLHYAGLRYPLPEGTGTIDLYFEQQETVVFVLYFVTPEYQQLQPTWSEIRASHELDPVLALEALADLDFGPLWLQPTPTPVVASTAEPAGFDIPPGKALFVFYNYTQSDWDIDIGPYFLRAPARQPGQEYTISQLAIDPGTYTWQGHSPDGDFYITKGNNRGFEITLAAGQAHVESVR